MDVPTWSWMAYKGGITFVDLPFGGVLWEESEIRSPWAHKPSGGQIFHSSVRRSKVYLEVVARGFRFNPVMDATKGKIVYDEHPAPEGTSLKCVIVGQKKLGKYDTESIQRHYVLIV